MSISNNNNGSESYSLPIPNIDSAFTELISIISLTRKLKMLM